MIHHLSAGTNDIARRLIPVQCRNARGRQAATPGNGVHVAFGAGRRAMVDLFYETALAYEGRDASARSTMPTILAPSSSIPIATRSRRSPIQADDRFAAIED